MSPQAIQYGGAAVDLSPRLFHTAAVVASPTDGTETIIASLTINEDIAALEGILLYGFGAWTTGTNGVSCNLKIRRTNASGSTVKATGAVTIAATELGALSLVALDTGVTPLNAVYVLTATLASASAASTFSAVTLAAFVI